MTLQGDLKAAAALERPRRFSRGVTVSARYGVSSSRHVRVLGVYYSGYYAWAKRARRITRKKRRGADERMAPAMRTGPDVLRQRKAWFDEIDLASAASALRVIDEDPGLPASTAAVMAEHRCAMAAAMRPIWSSAPCKLKRPDGHWRRRYHLDSDLVRLRLRAIVLDVFNRRIVRCQCLRSCTPILCRRR